MTTMGHNTTEQRTMTDRESKVLRGSRGWFFKRTPWSPKANMVILVLIIVCGWLLILSQGYLSRSQESLGKEGDLYLPEAGYLKFISLGHDGLISDLVLARALTYYGSHYKERHTFSFWHLKKLFFTAVEMDPGNREAFLMAGNILSDIDIHSAIEVLKLGMYYHPRDWKFPEMIGFRYFFNLNDSFQAAKYYGIASKLPGHPPYVPSLSGKLYQESGRYGEAIRVLYNFYSTTGDKRLKQSFKDSILAIRERIKNRDFQLKAAVVRVLDGVTLEFQPDPHNPQYQFLKSKETLRLKGLPVYNIHGEDEREKLFAFFQRDFARYVLGGGEVKIDFERELDGRLKQDEKGRFLGSIRLKNNKSYKEVVGQSGLIDGFTGFPPEAKDLDLDGVYGLAGKIVSLRFRVQRVVFTEKEILLHAASEYRSTFSAVVPREYAGHVAGSGGNANEYFKQLQGQRVTVSGLAVIQDRRVRMTVYLPFQIKLG